MISPDEGIYAGYVMLVYAGLSWFMFIKSERSK